MLCVSLKLFFSNFESFIIALFFLSSCFVCLPGVFSTYDGYCESLYVFAAASRLMFLFLDVMRLFEWHFVGEGHSGPESLGPWFLVQ